MCSPISRYTQLLPTRWPAGTVEKLPQSGELGVTNLAVVLIVVDLTGILLLKFSSKTGAEAVHAYKVGQPCTLCHCALGRLPAIITGSRPGSSRTSMRGPADRTSPSSWATSGPFLDSIHNSAA